MLETLRAKLEAEGLDALLVSKPANVRYLSHFTSPEDGRVLIMRERAVLLTDGRYTAQAAEESRLPVEIAYGRQALYDYLKETLDGQTLGIEADHVTLDEFEAFARELGRAPVATKGWVGELRVVKRPDELEKLREAARITDEAFTHILGFLRPGLKEIEVALELERFMLERGAEAKSFTIIVASGTRSSMPHGVASHKVIEQGELVTLDFGAVIGGYHADMTRTVAVGKASDEHKRLYYAVLEAQKTALSALGPGKDGRDIDLLAREMLDGYGLKEYFAHSLGHGVGLEVHEEPRLTYLGSYQLASGMTATVEPGVYLPGELGVRIEDLAVITDEGYELLSKSDKALLEL
jgi:Xaa-Pro aminopeptidase